MMQATRRESMRVTSMLLLALLAAEPAAAQRESATAAEAASLRKAPPAQTEAARRSREESAQPVVYRPPRRGSPRGRVAGGVRSAAALPQPLALAPDHVALTTHGAPSLFWHLDGPPPETARVVFTLILADGVAPLVERELPLPAAAGVQRVRLDDLGIALEPDLEYAWSISLLPHADDHDGARISERYLRRVDASALAGLAPSARSYAEQGVWYDALEALSDAIDAAPDDPALRAQRDSLLRQAGLEAALAQAHP
jgi:hypothetical protein